MNQKKNKRSACSFCSLTIKQKEVKNGQQKKTIRDCKGVHREHYE